MGYSILGSNADEFLLTAAKFLEKVGDLDVKTLDECLAAFRDTTSMLGARLEALNVQDVSSTIASVKSTIDAFNIHEVNNAIETAGSTLFYARLLIGVLIYIGILGSILIFSKMDTKSTDAKHEVRAENHGELVNGEEARSNLSFQEDFARCVYNLVSYQIDLNSDIQGPSQTEHKTDMSDISAATKQYGKYHLGHYFFVYHPASDWHASFHAMTKGTPLRGCMRPSNNLHTLISSLPSFRKQIGSTPVIHILLPSTHVYELPGRITIDEELLPLKITGQTHHSGKPYCQAYVVGLDEKSITEVELLSPRSDQVSASSNEEVTPTKFQVAVTAKYAICVLCGGSLTFILGYVGALSVVGAVLVLALIKTLRKPKALRTRKNI